MPKKLLRFPSPPLPNQPKSEADEAAERALAQRNRYVDEHKDLVEPIARKEMRRLPPSFDLDDLIQAGMVGLIRAAASYSRSKGEFEPWARWRIRDGIRDAVRRKNYTAATCLPLGNGGGNITTLERNCGASEDSHHRGEKIAGGADVVPIDGAIRRSQMAAKVHRALELLDDEDRVILQMYYFEERQLRGVGEYLGVGMSRSSQRVQMAREQLAGRLRALGVTEAA